MGAEEDHQLYKTEDVYLRKVSKTPGDFDYGAHTPTVHYSQDALEAVDRRAKEAFPHECFPQQPGRTGHENRGVTLQAPQMPECRKLKNESRNRCKLQNEEHM